MQQGWRMIRDSVALVFVGLTVWVFRPRWRSLACSLVVGLIGLAIFRSGLSHAQQDASPTTQSPTTQSATPESSAQPPSESIDAGSATAHTELIKQDAWARFGIGSWKEVKLTRETFDHNGDLQTTTSQIIKTTLVGVDERSYTLSVDVTTHLADRSFQQGPNTLTRGYYGERPGQEVLVRELGEGHVEISGRTYPARVHQLVVLSDGETRTTTLHTSPDIDPNLLARHTTATDDCDRTTLFESTVQVVALDMPHNVAGRLMSVSHMKTEILRANGERTETLEIACGKVPGGVVAHAARTADATGRVSERSTLELMAYQAFGKSVTAAKTP